MKESGEMKQGRGGRTYGEGRTSARVMAFPGKPLWGRKSVKKKERSNLEYERRKGKTQATGSRKGREAN